MATYDFLLSECRDQMTDEQIASLVQKVDSALANDRDHPRLSLLKAKLCNSKGSHALAEKIIRPIAKRDPGNAAAGIELGSALVGQGKWKRAEEVAITIRENASTDIGDNILSRVWVLPRLRYLTVVHGFATVLAPEDAGVHNLFGNRYFRYSKFKEAIGCFEKADSKGLDEKSPFWGAFAHYKMGYSFRELQDYQKATMELSIAWGMIRTGHDAPSKLRYHIALQLDLCDAWAKALEVLQNGISPNSRDLETLLLKGRLLTKAGRPKEAIVFLSKAIKLNPMDGETYLYRGKAYAVIGRTKESAADVKKAEHLLSIKAPRRVRVSEGDESVKRPDEPKGVDPRAGLQEELLTRIKKIEASMLKGETQLSKVSQYIRVVAPELSEIGEMRLYVTMELRRKHPTNNIASDQLHKLSKELKAEGRMLIEHKLGKNPKAAQIKKDVFRVPRRSKRRSFTPSDYGYSPISRKPHSTNQEESL
jgi:tetratricopeptide (TPR) repeat protein